MEEEQKRRFDGIWIPKEIWLSKDLSILDKVLLAEINSLDNEETHCFASNEYLANFCQCSERQITNSLSKLKSMGFIEQIAFNGRTRILKIVRQSGKIFYADRKKLPGEIYNIDYNIKDKEKILKENLNLDNQLDSSEQTYSTKPTNLMQTNALTSSKIDIPKTAESVKQTSSLDSGKEVISFILKDNSEFKVTEDIYNEYEQLYPNVNVMQELRNLKAWCISNPSKRKTRKGALRFVNGWLSRKQGQYSNNTSSNNYKAKVETKPAQKTDWHFEKNGVIGFGK